MGWFGAPGVLRFGENPTLSELSTITLLTPHEVKLALGNVVLDSNKGLGKKHGSMALPTTLFFDASGRLVATHLGALSNASLASALIKLQAPGVSPTKAPPR